MEYNDHRFEKLDCPGKTLPGREFNSCTFVNCNLEKSNLSATDFIECVFEHCNLSLADLKSTGLKDVKFIGCKLNGLDFSPCNDFLFSVGFTDCSLDYAVFQRKKMKKAVFRNCSIREAHFFETDLTEAVFTDCDLSGTYFDKNILEKADLRTARNYAFDPSANKMKKAKVSVEGLPGLVSQFGLIIE